MLGGKYLIKLKVCTTLTSERELKTNFCQQTCAACTFFGKYRNDQFLHENE